MRTRLGPTYLQKYAHDICISAYEWIKLRAQQFDRVSQSQHSLGQQVRRVLISIYRNVKYIGWRIVDIASRSKFFYNDA